MDADMTRRSFLKAAGLTVAGIAAAGTAVAQEQEKAKEEPLEKKKPQEKDKKEEKKAESPESKEDPKKKKEAGKSDEEDWDEAWKQSGTEETRTCPQCGATMYRQGRTWTCDNCGYSYVE